MSASNAMFLLFILAWSAFTLSADGLILRDIARQSLTAFYSRAPGTITHSQVTEQRGRKGPLYGFEVRYSYEVDGRKYEGKRYRSIDWRSSDREPAEDAVRRFPLGATVSVFHHPEAPADALLVTGVQGQDLFLLLFMNPFNLAMLAGWYGVRGALRKKKEDPVGAVLREGREHVRLEGMGVVSAGLLAFGGASFLSMFVVGFATGGDPSLPIAVLTWAVVITVGVLCARKQRAKLDSGHHDLILDEPNRRLSLPVGPGRGERLDVPWDQVRSVIVEARTRKDNNKKPVTFWCPTVVLTVAQGESRNEALAEWLDENRAHALVKWLGEKLTPRGRPR
jgi:hypothetical protein